MFAIIEGKKTPDYEKFEHLISDYGVAEYFTWTELAPNDDREGKICEEQVADAKQFYEEGNLSYDATLGQGVCVLYFPENTASFDAGDPMPEEICFHFRAYLAYLEDKRNGVY